MAALALIASPELDCSVCRLPIFAGQHVVFAGLDAGPAHRYCRQWIRPSDETVPCEGCGRTLYTVANRGGRSPVLRRVCSTQCRAAVAAAVAKRIQVPVVCPGCDREFTPARKDARVQRARKTRAQRARVRA